MFGYSLNYLIDMANAVIVDVEATPTRISKEVEAAELARVPMARWGTPDDVTPMFLFLASPAARFIVGQTFNVDGGFSVL